MFISRFNNKASTYLRNLSNKKINNNKNRYYYCETFEKKIFEKKLLEKSNLLNNEKIYIINLIKKIESQNEIIISNLKIINDKIDKINKIDKIDKIDKINKIDKKLIE